MSNINISGDMTTGEVTTRWPSTKEVFTKHFGTGCFTCPAFGGEPISMACTMHSTDVTMFVNELTVAAKKDEDTKKQ
jgi:hybrid cluster-associated redox disulfide protein